MLCRWGRRGYPGRFRGQGSRFAGCRIVDKIHSHTVRIAEQRGAPFLPAWQRHDSPYDCSRACRPSRRNVLWITFQGLRSRFGVACVDIDDLESEDMSTSQATQQQPGTGKMILILDDEADVRKLVAAVLTRNGYKVVTADNGDNAIKAHKRSKHPVDLLLLDVVSPGLSGPMVADRIVESQPGTRVLFMSGYDHTNVVQRYVVEKGYALLTKPFTPEQLAKKVREVMDAPAPVAR